MKRLVIFDFDGVIADSEVLSNTVLAECVSEMGLPTTREESYRLYMGKRMPEIIASIERAIGRSLPAGFTADFEARTFELFRAELGLVDGARDYLAAFPQLKRCIASSSTPARLALCLDVLGLRDLFGEAVFSAVDVPRGKPHPDIFLHAARMMDVGPADCLVIEDSLSGVQAARAAGMTVIGLTAASHILHGHGDRLRKEGADFVVGSFGEAITATAAILS
jgi:HAD superfamily hydrolase (TIGR01509 family)